jgi:hypothetical protein
VAITLQSDNPTSDSLWRSNISAESEKKWKSFVTKCWGFFSGTIPTFLSMWTGNFDEGPSDWWYYANFSRRFARWLKLNEVQFWCERVILMYAARYRRTALSKLICKSHSLFYNRLCYE